VCGVCVCVCVCVCVRERERERVRGDLRIRALGILSRSYNQLKVSLFICSFFHVFSIFSKVEFMRESVYVCLEYMCVCVCASA